MIIMPRNKFKLSDSLRDGFKKVAPATIGHWVDFGSLNTRIKHMSGPNQIIGTAFTVKTDALDSTMVHKAVSLAEPGDVIVIDRNNDSKYACVGEMVAYAAKSRNISGIIIDGPMTDINEIKHLNIPIYATGLSPITTRLVGESGEINTSIHCGGVSVSPGDIVFGDDNGVLILNNKTDLEKLINNAKKKEDNEPNIKKQLDKGIPLSSITKADEFIKNKISDE